jgi:protein gp37
MTRIEWTEKTWNPVAGCSPVSPGCLNCYAAIMAHRLAAMGQQKYQNTTERHNGRTIFNGTINIDPAALDIPKRVKKPTRWFVNSMSDLFHEDLTHQFRKQVFEVMNGCDWHEFQVLTKRPETVLEVADDLLWTPNIWMGTSIENATVAGRAVTLAQVPAEVRFLSVEPLLGPISDLPLDGIHWVIVGCESGPKKRVCDNQWVEDIVKQCRTKKVSIFIKQLIVDGKVSHSPSEWPRSLRTRKFPKTTTVHAT